MEALFSKVFLIDELGMYIEITMSIRMYSGTLSPYL